MSTATARRQEQRRRKRLRRLPREKAFQQRKAAFRQFPKVIYQNDGAPQALVDAVKMSVRQFVIKHAVALSPYETDVFHLMRRVGMPRAHELISKQLLRRGVSTTKTSAALFMPFATMAALSEN